VAIPDTTLIAVLVVKATGIKARGGADDAGPLPEIDADRRPEFAAARRAVKGFFSSVDPERADAARFGGYLAGYGPEFQGLTGSLEALQAVAASYFVAFYDEPAEDGQTRLITHSGNVFLVVPKVDRTQ